MPPLSAFNNSLFAVPGWFRHRQFFFIFKYRNDQMPESLASGIKNCTKIEKEKPCTTARPHCWRYGGMFPISSTLLAVERDSPCMYILLAGGKGYTLYVHTAGGGKGYTLYVHTAGGGKDKPCTCMVTYPYRLGLHKNPGAE
jgi:hypothetical protein